MGVVLYSIGISHPSLAARKMLELKGVDYRRVDVVPSAQRVHVRLAGFRRGTVPALEIDGRRFQGSREIARALDERWPDPPLFPSEPELRARVEGAERWGEEQLQPIPRRLFRFGVAHSPELRAWVLRRQKLPVAMLSRPVVRLVAAYYARTIEADGRRATEGAIRADIASLPSMLAHVDQLLADGTIAVDVPNAATIQIFSSVRALESFDDLRELVRSHACAAPAIELFGPNRTQLPRFIAPEWLAPLGDASPAAT
jgi:glutathione S-transferase